MPLHYNISKVYSESEMRLDVIQDIIITFLIDSEKASLKIGKAIKKKKHKKVLKNARLILNSVERFGMDTAYDNLEHIINWAKAQGKKKEIRTTYLEFQNQLESAQKELQKDYSLMDYIKVL